MSFTAQPLAHSFGLHLPRRPEWQDAQNIPQCIVQDMLCAWHDESEREHETQSQRLCDGEYALLRRLQRDGQLLTSALLRHEAAL